jgi:hypothetical protein
MLSRKICMQQYILTSKTRISNSAEYFNKWEVNLSQGRGEISVSRTSQKTSLGRLLARPRYTNDTQSNQCFFVISMLILCDISVQIPIKYSKTVHAIFFMYLYFTQLCNYIVTRVGYQLIAVRMCSV